LITRDLHDEDRYLEDIIFTQNQQPMKGANTMMYRVFKKKAEREAKKPES